MTTARRPGPAPRFTREQVGAAALAVVEEEGFDALSFRTVARQLGAGPATLYTYVDSGEGLAQLVVERLVADAVATVRWPADWPGVLRVFAKALAQLLLAHPAMVDAYARGMTRSGLAQQVAINVLDRLTADGLTVEQARDAYAGVHSVVLGYCVMATGRLRGPAAAAPSSGHPAWDALAGVQLEDLVEHLLRSVATGPASR